MAPAPGAATTTTTTTELPLRPQDELECRRCEVHCDKVVYPSACIDRACPFLYAFQEFGRTYIGCMQRVYGAEIDLEMLREAERRREGFGAMRTTRAPLPMCRVAVEECYGAGRTGELGCVYPEVHEQANDRPTSQVLGSAAEGA